jgi:ABC-2 type transport system permease protein
VQVPADVWLGKHTGWGLAGALGFQLVWALVLLAACQGVMRLATRKVVVQGG